MMLGAWLKTVAVRINMDIGNQKTGKSNKICLLIR